MDYPEENIIAKHNGCGNVSIPVRFTTKDGEEYSGVFNFDSQEWETEDAEYFSKQEVTEWRPESST